MKKKKLKKLVRQLRVEIAALAHALQVQRRKGLLWTSTPRIDPPSPD